MRLRFNLRTLLILALVAPPLMAAIWLQLTWDNSPMILVLVLLTMCFAPILVERFVE
jgi:hypothetical protein